MLDIYVGYDPRESVAFHVLAHSLLRRSSVPLSVSPLVRSQLGSIYTRPRGPIESTEFSMTRFLVPYLSGYAGWSLYMDCDMLCRTDIADLAAESERHADKAVVVCNHDYVPKSERKFLDQVQTKYARKNWSSLMLMNCAKLKLWTKETVETQSGAYLHRFQDIPDEEIGEIPNTWNTLDWMDEDTRLVHDSSGGPRFEQCRDHPYGAAWLEWRDRYRAAKAAGDPLAA